MTQNARPAGSRSACQPRPGPMSSAPRSTHPAHLCAAGRRCRGRGALGPCPSGSSSRWKSSWRGEPASSCHLPANSARRRVDPTTAKRARQKATSRSWAADRGVDADLDQAAAVAVGPGAPARAAPARGPRARRTAGRRASAGCASGRARATRVAPRSRARRRSRSGSSLSRSRWTRGGPVDLLQVDVRRAVGAARSCAAPGGPARGRRAASRGRRSRTSPSPRAASAGTSMTACTQDTLRTLEAHPPRRGQGRSADARARG